MVCIKALSHNLEQTKRGRPTLTDSFATTDALRIRESRESESLGVLGVVLKGSCGRCRVYVVTCRIWVFVELVVAGVEGNSDTPTSGGVGGYEFRWSLLGEFW